VRNLLVSSAPARRETKLAIMEAFRRSSLFEAYGSTEAGLVTLLRPEDQFTKIGTIGREIVGTGRIRLLDPAGVEVPEGEVGELYARTPTSFDCYWNQPEASARAFQGCYCTASDMARRDPDGYYTLVDRKSNVIITGGEKVYPSEVEQVLITHPAVREIAVIGLADDRWGEVVTAVVVPHAGCAPEPGSLIRHARERLAGYKVPKAVLFIGEEDMPHTVTGKIVHRVLRERYANAGAGENSRSPERKVP
jgi:acyl-CoA synthetase (AMP-forming)/AMP-acid ligase II